MIGAARPRATRSVSFREPDFLAPKRSSAATTMLVQTVSSPPEEIRLATVPRGGRIRFDSMLVPSRRPRAAALVGLLLAPLGPSKP